MVSSSVCERVLSRALSRGGTFAEIFIEDSRNFSMSLRDGRIENAALSRPYGAGVRVYDGLRSIYVYTCTMRPCLPIPLKNPALIPSYFFELHSEIISCCLYL